jgi:hypothetical protein
LKKESQKQLPNEEHYPQPLLEGDDGANSEIGNSLIGLSAGHVGSGLQKWALACRSVCGILPAQAEYDVDVPGAE